MHHLSFYSLDRCVGGFNGLRTTNSSNDLLSYVLAMIHLLNWKCNRYTVSRVTEIGGRTMSPMWCFSLSKLNQNRSRPV